MSLQVFHPFAFSIDESHPVRKLPQAETSVKTVPHCSTACFLGLCSTDFICSDLY